METEIKTTKHVLEAYKELQKSFNNHVPYIPQADSILSCPLCGHDW